MFRCPECGSESVRIEATCLVTYKPGGGWDVEDFDYSDEGYAECLNEDCLHDGIVESFKPIY